MNRAQLLAARVRAQQLDRDAGAPGDTAVLDLGVQDTGPDGARWALAVRGVHLDEQESDERLVTAWTVRGAPHVYRRADLAGIGPATAPWSDADAAKRIFDAAKPLKAAGIGILDALDTIAEAMRRLATQPRVKGRLSAQLRDRLPEPYLRACRPCDAIHLYEQPFRLAALRAGLVLQPGTSPPVLEPVDGAPQVRGVPRPDDVPAQLDVVRAYLRLYGPATPQLVAAYLDAPVREVNERWPADAEAVDVDGQARWALDLPATEPVRTTRLLAPFDPYLQVRDRELLVPDEMRRKELWPVLGRPGAVLVDGEVVGTWRPRTGGKKLAVTVGPWRELSTAERAAVDDQAEQLAATRGLAPGGVTVG